ncbi:MAG: hypothetical protein WHU10_12825 [Fimbriimonadales bacterium]
MSNAVMMLVVLGGLTLFGMLVVLPIVAVLADARSKGGRGARGRELEALQNRVRSLEARLDEQERRIADLKETLEVNIVSLEERRSLEQRLGAPPRSD